MVKRQIRVKIKGTWHTVEVEEPQRYPLQVVVDGEAMSVEVESGSVPSPAGKRPPAREAVSSPGLSAITQEDRKIIRSPMPGRIVSVTANVWDELEAGAEVCILETMKMEQSVKLAHDGTVRAVFAHPGQSVAAGTPLIQLS